MNRFNLFIEKEMKMAFFNLKSEGERISNMGWVQSLAGNNLGALGLTYESLLGKKADFVGLPDYQGIEIKVVNQKNNSPITLFQANPDNDLLETKRIFEKYGTYRNEIAKYKSFYAILSVNKYTIVDSKRKMRLRIDYEEKKIYLDVYDMDNRLIESQSYWSFPFLRRKLETKLTYLAIIKGKKKIREGEFWFCYGRPSFYQLKSFDYFISLIAEGYITFGFNIDVYKRGEKEGQMHDHGVALRFPSYKLPCLFRVVKDSEFVNCYNDVRKD